MSLLYGYWTLGMSVVYIFFLISQKKYRLLLPSIIHTGIWGATSLVMIFQIKGLFISQAENESVFSLSSKYMCFIVLSSIIGFTLAHIASQNIRNNKNLCEEESSIELILKKFQWIPYLCAITGGVLFIYIISSIGNFSTFSDYRVLSITLERVGYISIVQRISGHVVILGSFYLMLLGYKMGKDGLNMRKFITNALLCSMVNIIIGGRLWLVTSTLPFLITFIFSRSCANVNDDVKRKDKRNIFYIVLGVIILFSVLGILRTDIGNTKLMDKLLYLTDGLRMTNMALKQYPPDSYNLEYGRSEFLTAWFNSPMADNFNKSLAHDVGLSVTVKSSLPYLYFDFGFIGGIVMWGIYCFLIEYACMRLRYTKTIFGILLFGQLSFLLFYSPIFPIFTTNFPAFEWLLLLFIFRKYILGKTLTTC